MKNIAIIPARSGSKGLIDKNIKLLNGKPLMAYTIEAAIESNVFDTIMVSTDSPKYANIAKEYGAVVPFFRSEEMSSDEAGSWDVVKEVLGKYKELGKIFDTVCLLQPTSPLRNTKDIINAYELLKQKGSEAITSVCENDHPLEYLRVINQDLSMEKIIENNNIRRQDMNKIYRINGAIYIKRIINQNTLTAVNGVAYIMQKINSIDIDTAYDFIIAESIMKKTREELV